LNFWNANKCIKILTRGHLLNVDDRDIYHEWSRKAIFARVARIREEIWCSIITVITRYGNVFLTSFDPSFINVMPRLLKYWNIKLFCRTAKHVMTIRPVSLICVWIPFTYVQLLLCLTFEIKATFDLHSGIVLYKNTGDLSRESVMNYNCHEIITKCKVFHLTDSTVMHNIHCITQVVESVFKAIWQCKYM